MGDSVVDLDLGLGLCLCFGRDWRVGCRCMCIRVEFVG